MERMKKITERQREILDGVDDGKLSASQRDEYDGLQVEYDALEIETRRPGRRTEPNSFDMNSAMYSRGGSKSSQTGVSPKTNGRTYSEMFGSLSNDNKWNSLNDILSVVASGRHHDKLQPATLAATEGVSSDGGFLVGEEHSAEMLDRALESEIIRPLADVRPMRSDTKKIASFHHSDASGGSLFGGFTARWAAEAATATEETAKTRMIELTAKKLFVYSTASNELVQDGDSFEDQLSTAMISSVAWHLDGSFISGTGGNQPLGILNDAAIISVAKETGQGAATIVYENLAKMFSRLHPASVKNSIWICSSTAIPQLLQLSIAVGTGGSVVPVMSESNGEFRMLTRPVKFTEKMQSLGTVGDILLCDPTQYLIGMRKEITMDSSQHIGFASDTTAFRTIVRVDGMGKWSAAYTPANGSTQSWAIKLDTRA